MLKTLLQSSRNLGIKCLTFNPAAKIRQIFHKIEQEQDVLSNTRSGSGSESSSETSHLWDIYVGEVSGDCKRANKVPIFKGGRRVQGTRISVSLNSKLRDIMKQVFKESIYNQLEKKWWVEPAWIHQEQVMPGQCNFLLWQGDRLCGWGGISGCDISWIQQGFWQAPHNIRITKLTKYRQDERTGG